MRFCRFLPLRAGALRSSSGVYGLVEIGQIREIAGMPWGARSRGSRTWPLADERLVAPVEPTKILCGGRNYAAHAAELGNEAPGQPLSVRKAPASRIGPP